MTDTRTPLDKLLSSDPYFIIPQSNKQMIAGCLIVLNARLNSDILIYENKKRVGTGLIEFDVSLDSTKEELGAILLHDVMEKCGMLLLPAKENNDTATHTFSIIIHYFERLGFQLLPRETISL